MAPQKTKLSRSRKSLLSLCCGVISYSLVYPVVAAEFFTIIGPDGRPMVVQQRPEKKAEKTSKRPEPVADSQVSSKQAQNDIQQSVQKDTPENKVFSDQQMREKQQKKLDQSLETNESIKGDAQLKSLPSPSVQNKKSTATVKPSSLNAQPEKVQNSSNVSQSSLAETKKQKLNQNQAQHDVVQSVSKVESKTLNSAKVPTVSANHQSQNAPISAGSQVQGQSKEGVVESQPSDQVQQPHQNITEIDGVKYVDNEYLEDKEFNLEGRKRFYVMPDSSIAGSSRFETVEREKGISKSVFSKFLKNSPKASEPVVLAPTYYRLPKDEVVHNLEQACFSGKKIEKAKELSLNNAEVGFWPVPPIKEKFVYDVVKLDSHVQNIHFSSYASSQKNPSYYWPLVVFLDQQGCVIEGVSGFKNQDTQENNLKYSALEGVLKKPNQAMYLFMTPLAEAIDVQHVQLSNKGQIKLSVLR